jgi:hypothetical protein
MSPRTPQAKAPLSASIKSQMVSNDARRLGPFTNTDNIESSPRTQQAEAPLSGALCSHITRVDGVPVYFVLFPVKLWALFQVQPRVSRLCRTPISLFILLLSRTQLLSGNMRNLM